MVLAVGGSFYLLDRNGFFLLSDFDLQVEENENIKNYLNPKKSEIIEAMKSFQGVSLWDLDIQKVSLYLQGQSWIESYRISRVWPDKIRIEVNPKEVVFLFQNRKEDLIPVVKDGSLLPKVDLRTAPDVAIAHGNAFEKSVEMRKKTAQWLKELPPKGPFSADRIAEIQYEPKDGFGATLIQSGIKVRLGSEEKMPLKAQRVSQVLEYIQHRNLEAKLIDADLSKKVLVRLKSKTAKSEDSDHEALSIETSIATP